MVKPKKEDQEVDTDRSPEEAARARDDILKRMLHTKPKHQKDVVAERKRKRAAPRDKDRRRDD